MQTMKQEKKKLPYSGKQDIIYMDNKNNISQTGGIAMNKRFRSMLSVLLALVFLLSFVGTSAQAGDDVKVDVSAKFLYDEARSMLKLVNNFRTGKEANYIDKDNVTVVKVKGLKDLQYDYNLEKIAMQRALEIAVYFSHTRPNGKKWSTAHSGRYTMGENLAYGYGSAKSAFNGFKEDDEDYSGQGHRRNMLQKGFTRAGFGCVKVGGTVYWAQEFGSGKAGGKSSDKYSNKTVDATWKTLKTAKTKISASTNELTVAVGEQITLPKVVLTSRSGAKNALHGPKWSLQNEKVARIKDSKLIPVKEGSTELTIDVNGTKLKVKVTVAPKSGKAKALTESLDDYITPLGLEDVFFVDDEEVAFLDESDIPEGNE